MTLGDRIVVMRDGRVEQAGAPAQVYREPATTFVARFVGSPPMNLFAGPVPALGAGEELIAGVRPHDILLTAPEAGDADATGVVELVEPLGSELRVHLAFPGTGGFSRATAVAPPDAGMAPGDRVGVRLRRDRLHLFRKSTGQRLAR